MRLIFLALSLVVGIPAHAAAPELLASLDALFDKRAEPDALKELEASLKKVKQGSVAYDPPEARRVQEWAKSVEAKIAKELE